MSNRLLWPDLAPSDVEKGWLGDVPESKVTTRQVLDAVSARHPMDGFNGKPGRWVFLREVQAGTGAYSDVQRFDAVAIGLVPSVKYARVVYEVKVSRGDWLRELRPIPVLTYPGYGGHRLERRLTSRAAAELRDNPAIGYRVEERLKWAEALAVSTEFWIAAPPHVVQADELPPEAGLVEVRPWGPSRELRAKVVRKAAVRETPLPGVAFWASALREAAARRSAE